MSPPPVVVLTGVSGAGKSTVGRALAGWSASSGAAARTTSRWYVVAEVLARLGS